MPLMPGTLSAGPVLRGEPLSLASERQSTGNFRASERKNRPEPVRWQEANLLRMRRMKRVGPMGRMPYSPPEPMAAGDPTADQGFGTGDMANQNLATQMGGQGGPSPMSGMRAGLGPTPGQSRRVMSGG